MLLHRPTEDHVRGLGATGGGGQLDASPHETSLHLQSEAEARPREGEESQQTIPLCKCFSQKFLPAQNN